MNSKDLKKRIDILSWMKFPDKSPFVHFCTFRESSDGAYIIHALFMTVIIINYRKMYCIYSLFVIAKSNRHLDILYLIQMGLRDLYP